MDKRVWVSGFSFALALSAAGCSEVDNCSPGAKACIGGPCDAEGECKFNLECVVADATNAPICGKANEDGTFDCNGIACRAESVAVPCNCTGLDETCLPGTSDQCVNYCMDPGTESVEARRAGRLCRPEGGSDEERYREACKTLWWQFCARAPVWCPGYECTPGFIESEPALAACQANYPVLEDVSTRCEALRGSTCETFDCTSPAPEIPNAFAKSCANPGTCLNTCPEEPTYTNDGSCDDGDITTAAFDECTYGTDCGDCGPRTGTAPVLPVKIGELCVQHAQCADNSPDYRFNKSWCLEVGETGIFRCMPDCSRSDNCGEDYRCTTLESGGKPLMDNNGITAKVCDPLICM